MSTGVPPGEPGRERPRRASLYGQTAARGGPKFPKEQGWFRRSAPWIALGLVALVSGVLGYVLLTLRDLPDPGQMPVLARSVVVYDRKGREIEQRNAQGEYYQVLHLNEMGLWGPAATLAAEDRDFYHHGAIDLVSTARAAAADVVRGGYAQGGSTITQQLVKIQVLTPQKSIFRKMQEAVLATALESRYSKDQILEMYLNRVYYGHNAYGLGAATKVFFGNGKEAKDLTVGQAAFLAALINGPGYYDPQTNYDRAKSRQLYVLDGLVKTGKLTQAQADEAAQEDIKAELKFDQSFRKSRAAHFVDYVIGKLEQQVGPADVQKGGFRIYTTLDLDLQDAAQQAVSSGVAKLKGTGVNNGDLLAAKPDTGEILAWVGSADYYNDAIAGQYDVITSARQPGSSFKPYVFEAALREHKITLASTLHDRPTDFGGGYKPKDFDGNFMGDLTARRSLLLSRNVPAVETAQIVGIGEAIKQAHAQGVKTDLKPGLSTAIGASEVTMLEHLQGYQVFANQGTLVPLIGITKILDAQDNTVFAQQPGNQEGITKPISPAEAFLITDTLKDYQTQWNLGWRPQMAGKSGTTDVGDIGAHRDAWMMAYNPNIVVGAWAGNTAPNGGGNSISTFGTQVGQQILAPFLNGLPTSMRSWYKRPDGLATGTGCGGTGGGTEIFLPGTEHGVNCPTPTPTPPPTPTPTPQPSPTPSARPSILPTITPKPSPSRLPLITPTPSP